MATLEKATSPNTSMVIVVQTVASLEMHKLDHSNMAAAVVAIGSCACFVVEQDNLQHPSTYIYIHRYDVLISLPITLIKDCCVFAAATAILLLLLLLLLLSSSLNRKIAVNKSSPPYEM